MTQETPRYRDFRHRLRDREHLLGTFIKTPTTHATEILGSLGYDFIIIDQEHAPFDRAAIDLLVFAARSVGIAPLVRVGDASDGNILSVLDCGAMGILVPHVDSAARARQISGACRYRKGHRGFANTTRAGGFGDALFSRHIAEQDDQIACVAMIEDLSALGCIDEILADTGLDAIFVGRGDLTAALGQDDQTNAQTLKAVETIMQAARKANMPAIVLPSDRKDAAAMQALGANAFVLSNDQSMFKRAARQALQDFAAPL